MKVVYVGGHADVLVPGSGTVALAGEPVDVPDDVAGLLLQTPVWREPDDDDGDVKKTATTRRAAAHHKED